MKSLEKMGFRHYVHYAIAILAIHLASYLFRVIVFSGMFAQSVEDGDGMAKAITVCFSLVVCVIFCLYCASTYAQDGERRRSFTALAKEQSVTWKDMLRWSWKKHLIHAAMFAVFQLPFLVFYSCFGIVYVNGTFFDSFYCMEAGFYEMTGIGIVGFFLHCGVLFIGQCIGDAVVYRQWDKQRV